MWREDIFKACLCKWDEGKLAIDGYQRIPGGWINIHIAQCEKGNEIWQGSVFQERTRNPFSTTSVETEILTTKLSKFLSNYAVPKDAFVMDAGCADGRITHILLEAGMECIVSTDLNQESVHRLVNSLSEVQKEKVLAIVDDFSHLPIADQTMDVVVASALFAEMPDFTVALQSAMRILKRGGLLFYFDPVLEHGLIYALVRQDIEEFERIAKTSTRARMWDQKDRRYRVYYARELEEYLLKHPALKILEKDGISILPSLIFGGILQDKTVEVDKKKQLKEIILTLSENGLQVFRQIIYVCRREQ
jgi:ubiquinone/menaquinone biosynthesis C-methylase UbiE